MKYAVTYTSLWYIVPIWLLLLGSFVLLAGFLFYDDHRFAAEGIHVTGRVVGMEMRPFHGRHGNVQYNAVISFEYPAGALTGRATQIVEEETYYDLSVGGPIPIIFLRDHPGHYRIDMAPEKVKLRLGRFGCSLAIVLTAGVGGWAVGWTARRNRLWTRLVNQGARCRGEVLQIVTVRGYRNSTQTYLTFRFTTGKGEEIQGRSSALGWGQQSAWQQGDLIDIWYDPARPQDFTIDLSRPHHPVPA